MLTQLQPVPLLPRSQFLAGKTEGLGSAICYFFLIYTPGCLSRSARLPRPPQALSSLTFLFALLLLPWHPHPLCLSTCRSSLGSPPPPPQRSLVTLDPHSSTLPMLPITPSLARRLCALVGVKRCERPTCNPTVLGSGFQPDISISFSKFCLLFSLHLPTSLYFRPHFSLISKILIVS